MSVHYEAIYRDHLMIRRGVNSLIAAFSTTMDGLEADGHGLGRLLRLRIDTKERECWNNHFDVFYEKWATAFAEARAGEHPRCRAICDAGLQCLGEIRNDLRNDLWTDKAMQREPSSEWFGRLFWTQVRQKMIFAPIMIGCGVSRETAIRMTKFAAARREILASTLRPPETDQLMFEAIASHIGEVWSSVEKIGHDLPLFLKVRGSDQPSLRALDEIDFLDAETELAGSVAGRRRGAAIPATMETTSATLFDLLPVGTASAHEEIVPDVLGVLATHCLPELKKRAPPLFAAFRTWRKKVDKNEEAPAPEDGSEIHRAFQLLRGCIEREFRRRLAPTCGEKDD